MEYITRRKWVRSVVGGLFALSAGCVEAGLKDEDPVHLVIVNASGQESTIIVRAFNDGEEFEEEFEVETDEDGVWVHEEKEFLEDSSYRIEAKIKGVEDHLIAGPVQAKIDCDDRPSNRGGEKAIYITVESEYFLDLDDGCIETN